MIDPREWLARVPGITPGATRQNLLVVLLVLFLGTLLVVGVLALGIP